MSDDPNRRRSIPNGISRRKFLAGLGLAAGTAVAAATRSPCGHGDPSSTAGTAYGSAERSSADATTALVFVELAGGNDGIGTVIPYTDPELSRLRPTLAIDNPLDLDGSVGLHPSLAKLADRYQRRAGRDRRGHRLPRPDLSHFASLANWWSGTPGEAATGWLGRYLDHTVGLLRSARRSGDRARAVARVARRAGRSQRGSATPPVSNPRAGVGRRPDDLVETWSKFAPASPDPATLLGQVQRRSASPRRRAPSSRGPRDRHRRHDRSRRDDLGPPPRATTGAARRSPTRSNSPPSSSRRSTPPKVDLRDQPR